MQGDLRRHPARRGRRRPGSLSARIKHRTGGSEIDGWLHAALTRSPHAHAAVLGIDVDSVLGRPGVLDVLTAAELPGALCYGPTRSDRPVLAAGVVRHREEPVAAVLAVDPDTAAAAAAALEVTYRELAEVWAHRSATADPLHPDGNVLRAVHLRRDAGAGPIDWSSPDGYDFAPDEPGHPDPVPGADVVVDGAYGVGYGGWLGHDGRPAARVVTEATPLGAGVRVRAPRRWAAADRDQVAQCLDLDPALLELETADGELDPSTELGSAVVAAALALRHSRPVALAVAPGPYRSGGGPRASMRYRHHARSDGTLVAVQARIVIDAGPYAGLTEPTVAQACATGAGPYRAGSVDLEVSAVRSTDLPPLALPRAGAVAVAFAVEAQLDRLADRLGLDRREVRLRNCLELDDPLPTGQMTLEASPVPALWAALAALPQPPGPPADPLRGRGVGTGVSMVPWGEGEGDDPPAGATVRFAGGRATVWCPGAEHDEDLRAAAVGVAAAAFGVPAALEPSGDEAPRAAAPTVGAAVQTTIDALTLPARERLAGRVGMSPRLLRATGGRLRSFDGVLDVALDEAMAGDPEEASARVVPVPSEPLDDEGQGDAYPGFSYAVCRAVVEQTSDGDVEIVALDIAADCGRALDADRLRAAVGASATTGVRLAMPQARLRDGALRVVHLHEGSLPKGAAGVATGAVASALRAASDDATGGDADVLPIPGVSWSVRTVRPPDGAS